MATYEIEFGALGDTRPVPPLTVRTGDTNELSRTVVEHARPHITPVLTEMGRPELADWLDHAADTLNAGRINRTDLVICESCCAQLPCQHIKPALAVARALSGPCPHCHGGRFLPHSHELPGRRP